MPNVTVALITYNRPKFLPQAIEAILKQTYNDFEFLIFDNGSGDETQKIIRSYSDARIVIVRNEVNDREFYNKPFEVSKGKYLLITHDDDIMHPDMLKKEVEVLDNDESVVVVGCNAASIDENNKVLKESLFKLNNDLIYHQNEYLKYFLSFFHMTCPTALMRKDFFVRNNLKFDFSVGPGADTYLWYKVSEFPVKIILLNEVLYNYRVHNNQDSVINRYSLYEPLYEGLLKDTKNKPHLSKERKQIVMKMMYDSFGSFENRIIDYNAYSLKIAKIIDQNKPRIDLLLKLKFYQLAPTLVRRLLTLKNSFQSIFKATA